MRSDVGQVAIKNTKPTKAPLAKVDETSFTLGKYEVEVEVKASRRSSQERPPITYDERRMIEGGEYQGSQ